MRNLFFLTAAVLALGAGAARATTFTGSAIDPVGDFLTGAVHDADLDLTGMTVTYDDVAQTFLVSATLAGPINTGNPGNYVLGVNTGSGAIHPFTGVGQPDVRFNQAFVLQKTGAVNNAAVIATLSGSGFSLLIQLATLPATVAGFQPGDYGFNIWSRGPGNQLVDFAPENRMLAAVPEPATWAMMIMGFGLAGGALRRRRMQGRLGVPA
ncbi:PEPxxWA-CTERM sorting domain-containing protein [Phenylobacterium sp.]|uniref:PEPxxWA-CTERM sorting domain-containing protein n=1 Tax=Phenylobacterium sp. TaxID=1871053 RepID=UPI00374C90FA